MAPRRHHAVREGLIAGVLGATTVAVWFLILDSIAGRPFHTPAVLGTALLGVLGPAGAEGTITRVIVYTIFHYVAFCAAGILLTVVIHQAAVESSILAGFLILFVAFEIGFYGFTALLSQRELLGDLAWYHIGIGNLLAAATMGTYLWRTHPELGPEFAHALGGSE
jgi:hypothetical protein